MASTPTMTLIMTQTNTKTSIWTMATLMPSIWMSLALHSRISSNICHPMLWVWPPVPKWTPKTSEGKSKGSKSLSRWTSLTSIWPKYEAIRTYPEARGSWTAPSSAPELKMKPSLRIYSPTSRKALSGNLTKWATRTLETGPSTSFRITTTLRVCL